MYLKLILFINIMDKKNNMSFSMYVDNNSSSALLPRNQDLWVDDNKETNCFGCKTFFNMFRRKHHCRGCGRIFCSNCSDKIILTDAINDNNIIDKDKYIKENYNTNYNINLSIHRACYSCYRTFISLKILASNVKILELLPIDLKNIYKFKAVSRIWSKANIIYLSRFREIQYILPCKKLKKNELFILNNNIHLLGQHNKLLTLYIKSIDWDNTDDKKINLFLKSIEKEKMSCWQLMCGRCCRKEFDISNILDILYSIKNKIIREYFIKKINLDDNDIDNFLPIIMKCVKNDECELLINYLIERCSINNRLRIILFTYIIISLKTYPELNIYKVFIQKYKNYLLKNFGKEIYENIYDTFKFFQMFNDISVNNTNRIIDEINIFLKERNVKVPPLFIDKIKKVENKIEIKNSFTKPIIFKCKCLGNNNKIYYKKLMYKNEDNRIDAIIMRIIKFMNKDLINNGLEYPIITYDIIPISLNSGIIEIVDNCESIYDIRKTKCTLLNHILEKNLNDTIENIRNNFMKSTSIYCVISYLLGIGDRHLDNIMVTNTGCLFHIDFTFSLGQDVKIWAPQIRLTYDMVDSIGGENSKNFERFKEHCNNSFKILKNHHNLIMILLYELIEDENIYNMDMIEKLILKRFVPNELERLAEIQLVTTLENSKDQYQVIDFLHYHSKEKTISNTVYNLLDNTMSIPNYFKSFFK